MCRGRPPEQGEEEGPPAPVRGRPSPATAAAAVELEWTIGRLAETYAELVALRAQLAAATALLERSRAQLAEVGRRLAEERTSKERLLAANAAVLSSLAGGARRGVQAGDRPDEASAAD